MHSLCEIIKNTRESKGISQEELADSVLSVSSLSRLERGEQFPDMKIFMALFEKLKLPTDLLMDMHAQKYDLEIVELVDEINAAIRFSDVKKLRGIVSELKTKNKKEAYYKELSIYSEIVLKDLEGEDVQILYNITKELVEQFITEFKPSKIRKALLTRRQVAILNLFAGYTVRVEELEREKEPEREKELEGKEELEKKKNQKSQGVEIWKELRKYISSLDRYHSVSKNYAGILYNLSANLGHRGHYEECLSISQEGIDICLKYDIFSAYPGLLENKGFALISLGNVENGQKIVEEACVIYHSRGEIDKVRNTKNLAKTMGVEIVSR